MRGMRISLDFCPKPDAAGVPHAVALYVDLKFVGSGNGDSDAAALRDLIHTIEGTPDLRSDILIDSLKSSLKAAEHNEGRQKGQG
jgi:hypothetical protein